MIEKIKTALWFARRPDHWTHAAELSLRKFRQVRDGPETVQKAEKWARDRAVTVADALASIGLMACGEVVPAIDADLMDEGNARAERSSVRMGGPGDVDLLYAAVALSGAKRAVETGVAYGWSSLAILSALDGREGARLVSVDMPYPKMNNEAFVGIVVPERLRKSWEIVRQPDRRGLEIAIARNGGKIDLGHYDSDKSWWGRQYGYRLLWDALVPGGVFISDDIQDNMAFAEFVEAQNLPFAVTESDGKFVGILMKRA